MKTIALISTVFALPAASLLAQGQSDIDALRSRVDSAERRINLLESEISRLRSSAVVKQAPQVAKIEEAKSTADNYTVVKGDYLARIAKRHNTTVAALKRINGLRSNHLRIGQKLRIPVANKQAVKSTSIVKEAAPAKSQYKVKQGETFYSIARQHNISVSELMAANPSVKATRLRQGQILQMNATPIPSRAVAKSQPSPKTSTPRKPKAVPAPKPTKEVVQNTPVNRSVVKKSEPAIRTITVNQQITYGSFASKYGASTTQLNELNGLTLNKSTMLAKGSELYVPQY